MTTDKALVEKYMEGFRLGDHAMILACLTDDIVWDLPGVFHKVGKKAFDREIENDAFQGRPAITTSLMTEEKDVVVAKGTVRTQKKTGEFMDLAF